MAFPVAACAAATAHQAKQPDIKLDATLTSTSPLFGYIVGKPYTLTLTASNVTSKEIMLGGFSVSWTCDKRLSINAKPNGNAPTVVQPSENAVAKFTLKFPAEAAGQQVTLIGKLDYTSGTSQVSTDCRIYVQVTPELEITILPARTVFDGRKDAGRIGMSIINHTESTFKGKITLTTTPGISIEPTSADTQIESEGLDAKVYTLTHAPDAAPGHYAVFVDVGGKQKDWAAVDLPVMAKKTHGPAKLDGKLHKSGDDACVDIAKPIRGA